jgi:Signal transduction histidine kinase
MQFKSKISHKGLLLVSVPLIFELVFVGTLFVLLKQTQEVVRRETRSRAVVAEANQLSRCLFDAGTSLIAWKYYRSETFLTRERENISLFESGLARLKNLTEDDERQSAHVLRLEQMGSKILHMFGEYQTLVEERTTYPTLGPVQRLQFVRQGLNPFLTEVQTINREESQILDLSPLSAEKSQRQLDQFLLTGVLANIFLALTLAQFFSKQITKRVSILIENSKRLASRQPLLQPVKGTDEVAELDRVFHQMASSLALSERKRREFVEMVSHDLRSPLSAIRLTLALVAKGSYGTLSEKGEGRVNDAEKDTERLLSLVNDLIDMERLDSGFIQLDVQNIAAFSLVEDSVSATQPLADEKSLTIEVSCDKNLELRGDKGRLTRVLINLLSNAIRFSPDGKKISVAAQRVKSVVRFVVTDEGQGIAQEDQERIFTLYEQVGPESKSSIGSGIGLAISKALVEAHHGTIGVESELAKGSSFWFEIPSPE